MALVLTKRMCHSFHRVCHSCIAGPVSDSTMERERRLASSIVAALLVLAVCAGRSQAADHLGGIKSAAPNLVWRTIAPMQTARYGAGAEFLGDQIDIIGGFDAHGSALSTVESYDLDYHRWSVAPPMPTARGDFGIDINGRSNGSITVLGGADSHGRLLNVVERYDPPGVGEHPNAWYRLPPMPQARRGLAALPGMIAGGIGHGGTVLNSVMESTENIPKRGNISWRARAPMHTPRSDFALAWIIQ
jgi:Kelch motif